VTPQLANRLATLQIAFTMSGLMSGSMVAVNHGLSGDFLHSWLRNWMVAFAVAYPTATAIVPLSRKWVEKVTRRETMKS
jgi:uncharacterized membrane protein required for colicin V production